MKTLPIIDLSGYNQRNTLIRAYMKQIKRLDKIMLITPPEQKQNTLELISEKENTEILEKIKKYNKEMFGI